VADASRIRSCNPTEVRRRGLQHRAAPFGHHLAVAPRGSAQAPLSSGRAERRRPPDRQRRCTNATTAPCKIANYWAPDAPHSQVCEVDVERNAAGKATSDVSPLQWYLGECEGVLHEELWKASGHCSDIAANGDSLLRGDGDGVLRCNFSKPSKHGRMMPWRSW